MKTGYKKAVKNNEKDRAFIRGTLPKEKNNKGPQKISFN